ncbi:hypothetical protein [Kitasatospora sp. NRRL B-11411]|uniref:hypothetical protein n=1 Tax=Kitasatospora sp. NRRL B-11411 TaxID=1463822 RepID=UPI0004C444A0|nr:hypothetical protein [Kitasatospora sp. NRRL B-11411]
MYIASFHDARDELDLDELDAVDPETARTINRLFDPESSLWIIAKQWASDTLRRPGARLHDYFLLLDSYAVYNERPGAPQLIAAHFDRDPSTRTVRASMTSHALIPLAQNWLVGRGADPSRVLEPQGWSDPLDAETERLEDFLRTSGERFEVHDTFSRHEPPYETWVIATDTEQPPGPAEVFIWRLPDDQNPAYTVRRGQFASLEAAYEWTRDTSAPLPASPRTQAARLRVAPVQPSPAQAPAPPPTMPNARRPHGR